MNHDMTVTINGTNVTDWGLKPLQIPPVTRAAERIETHSIPGRPEPYIERTGELEMLRLPVEFFFWGNDPTEAVDHLMGAKTIAFGENPAWLYDCAVVDRVELPRQLIKEWNKVTVTFLCSPLQRRATPAVYQTANGSLTVPVNAGNVPARPTIVLTVPSVMTVSVEVGAQEFELFEILPGTYTVDSESRTVRNQLGGNYTNSFWGEFPEIHDGPTAVTANVNVFTVRPNWRRR